MPFDYGFAERLQMSQGISATKDIAQILLENIPGALAVAKATEQEDRSGTDYWIKHRRGESISVDVKVRSQDFAFKPMPNRADDLALEIWSVKEKQIKGWTLDSKKMTDFVLWYWSDSGRWCLVPFAMLCAVFEENLDAWIAKYKRATQRTPNSYGSAYHSECVFVPRNIVWREIYKKFSGHIA